MARLKDEPFALIGINSDDDLEKLKPALEKESITWRSFWNGKLGTSGPISTAWGVSSWPTIFVLDEEGVIRYMNVREEKMDEAVDTLLAELKAKQAKKGGGK